MSDDLSQNEQPAEGTAGGEQERLSERQSTPSPAACQVDEKDSQEGLDACQEGDGLRRPARQRHAGSQGATKHTPGMTVISTSNRFFQAHAYIDRGWNVTPVLDGEKAPILKEWNVRDQLSPLETKRFFKHGQHNIGVRLGAASNNLVDVDLDTPQAIHLAGAFLPATPSIFGRHSAPRSHWLYIAPQAKTEKFVDCRSGEMLVELRSTGAQTIAPPSYHRKANELVRWDENGVPAPVSAATLRAGVARLAAATLLARHWPGGAGIRQELSLPLAGALLKGGWGLAETQEFVGAVAREAGDDEAPKRLAAVKDTADAIAAHQRVTGTGRLAELLGADLVAQLVNWLGLNQRESETDPADEAETIHATLAKIYTMDAALVAQPVPTTPMIVTGLLPAGLTLLGSKPKTGKSVLTLGLAIAVAQGAKELWPNPLATFETPRMVPGHAGGSVLYLSLQENPRLIRRRYAKMMGNVATPRLHIVHGWSRDRLGAKIIDAWVQEHEDACLVVIDMLADVVKRNTKGDAYTADYEALGFLRELCTQHENLAVLVNHHLRKAPGKDAVDLMSATLGLSGGVDTVLTFIPQRSDDEDHTTATLEVLSREDLPQVKYRLARVDDKMTWVLLGVAGRVDRDQNTLKVEAAREKLGPLASRESVAGLAGVSKSTVKRIETAKAAKKAKSG